MFAYIATALGCCVVQQLDGANDGSGWMCASGGKWMLAVGWLAVGWLVVGWCAVDGQQLDVSK